MSKRRISRKAGWVNPCNLPRGPNGRALCRFCYTEVPKGRRTFCSDLCVHHHKVRSNPTYVRQRLRRRDKGVCAHCGLDTIAEETRLHTRWPGSKDLGALARWKRQFKKRLGADPGARRRRSYWDADHIVPVAEGGGETGIDNFQTLCLPCHRIKTAQQASRAAAVKRGETPTHNEERKTMTEAKQHPSAKQMMQGFKKWFGAPDSDTRKNARKIITASKLRDMIKAMDPEGRVQADVHDAICTEVAEMVRKAFLRAYDNKRTTIRPSDL